MGNQGKNEEKAAAGRQATFQLVVAKPTYLRRPKVKVRVEFMNNRTEFFNGDQADRIGRFEYVVGEHDVEHIRGLLQQ
jgi:hypothetical protein